MVRGSLSAREDNTSPIRTAIQNKLPIKESYLDCSFKRTIFNSTNSEHLFLTVGKIVMNGARAPESASVRQVACGPYYLLHTCWANKMFLLPPGTSEECAASAGFRKVTIHFIIHVSWSSRSIMICTLGVDIKTKLNEITLCSIG